MRCPLISKTTLLKIGLIILIIVIGIWMFLIGKMHTVLLDNKTIEVEGISYVQLPIVEVQIDNKEKIELAARDRDLVEVTAQRHKITVYYTDKLFNEHKIVKKFKIPLGYDMVLISIPALIGETDVSDWLSEYIPPTAVVAPQAETETVDELGIDFSF
ncbi:MAG: DUF6672 family protein [Sphaerochaetaceae bacterium]